MLQIGHYILPNNLIVAPMAGVTDRPFRQLCRRLGAGLAVSEMVASNPALRNTFKTRKRMDHEGEPAPSWVQIAGAEPAMMAEAARYNVAHGAQIIDINLGCPAKKVCNKLAGSALMRDEKLVSRILDAVVNAVDVPVTLKMRTGWSPDQRNGLNIARIAEKAGIRLLSVHGRTRACGYGGTAEYDTIAVIKAAIRIPVLANGDIDSPEKAQFVLKNTGADGLMIGRAAQGNPWIFREIDHFLRTGTRLTPPEPEEVRDTLIHHLESLYQFYGDYTGVRIARKHLGWYSKTRPQGEHFRKTINTVETPAEQVRMAQCFFDEQAHCIKSMAFGNTG